MTMNHELKKYIENEIFPQYEKNDEGHKIGHIKHVIKRCFELSKDKGLDLNILFTIASYHDIGHHIDSKNHEIISANIMYKDKILKRFFNKGELLLIKEAIEDHRASLDREPRSAYGKIVSSADRPICVDESIKKAYFIEKKYSPHLTDEQLINNSYSHLNSKYGDNGYASFFVEDEKYENYLKEFRELLNDKEQFIIRCKKIISSIVKITDKPS